MEIRSAIAQLSFYHVERNDAKKIKNDVLKKIIPVFDIRDLYISKLVKEKNFSQFSSKENLSKDDVYDLDFRTVTKNIMDLELPLCDTGTGQGGG